MGESKAKNWLVRSASGAVYVAVLVACVLFGGVWLTLVLCLLTALGVYELTAMTCETKLPRVTLLIDVALCEMLVLASCRLSLFGSASMVVYMAVWLGLLQLRLISQLYSSAGNPVHALGRTMLTQLYIALPLAILPVLATATSSQMVLALLIFIWVNDTGAFCVGSLFGRHRLFERVSPKKSWEGFFGGVMFCIAAAFIMKGCFGGYYPAKLNYGLFCVLAVLTSVAATFGDLVESLIKRSSNVKDSGHIIPGHGGILDRIDSLLMVMPAAAVFFMIFFT